MQLICPDCLGTLSIIDGKTARCTTHGGEFQVLFSHWKPAPPPLPPEPSPVEFLPAHGAKCFQHPDAPATHVCSSCGTPLCETCAYDGSRCCSNPAATRKEAPLAMAPANEAPPVITTQCAQHPNTRASFICSCCGTPLCEVCMFKDATGACRCGNCMLRTPPAISPLAPLAPVDTPPPMGARCVQHPQVDATRRCKLCGSFMCATCDFVLPDGYHVCPACAATPQTGLSRGRKKLLIAAYLAAVWSTIVLGAAMGGAFSTTRGEDAGIFLLLFTTILVASIAGFCLALAARHRQLPNPVSVWIAIVWNGMLLGGYLLLIIYGMLKPHL